MDDSNASALRSSGRSRDSSTSGWTLPRGHAAATCIAWRAPTIPPLSRHSFSISSASGGRYGRKRPSANRASAGTSTSWRGTPPAAKLLVIEVKTEIVDVGELLGTLDRKERLARRIAARMGWEPTVVSLALVVHDSRMNRRRVAEHRSTFGAVLPSDGRVLRAHLRHPRGGRIAAVAFWSILRPGGTRHAGGGIRRVRTARPAPIRAQPRSQTLL